MSDRETTRDECGCWRETGPDPTDLIACHWCPEHEPQKPALPSGWASGGTTIFDLAREEGQ